MKGYIVKKVFKTIGLVFAAVLGFLGAVVGVMAAMGKFKTPEVYPTVLEFAVTEEVVIEGNTFDVDRINEWESQFEDKAKAPQIYSFIISGSNPNEEHEVNQKDCYIEFKDVKGSKLITLCEANGKPLVKDKNNRYLVKCNEPVYYMINALKDNSEGATDGKVVLRTKSVNENLKLPDNDMTIWIDRVVEEIFIDCDSIIEHDNTQTINVGVGIGLDFKYIINTPLSLQPISKESAKEIELYYNVEGMGYGDDFLLVTKEEIDKEDSPLHSILTHDGDKITFLANTANPSTHRFYLAVFKTYQAKMEYEAKVNGLSLAQPNHHKLNSVDDQNSPYMTVTNVVIEVESTEISQIGFDGTDIALNLYKENEVIYLDNSDAEQNNLGIYLKRGTDGNQTSAPVHYNEFNLGTITSDMLVDKEPVFVDSLGQEWDEVYPHGTAKIYELTKINVCDGYTVVKSAYAFGYEERKFYTYNGVAVTNGTDIKMLKTGKYLTFYIKDDMDNFNLANFTFDVVEDAQTRSWKITTKSMPTDVEKLCLGALVVNSSGLFDCDNLFKTQPVTLKEIDLLFGYQSSRDLELDINFKRGNETVYGSLAFDEIIELKSGSYDACVFMVQQNPSNVIKTIDNIQYVDPDNGNTYVLVGDFFIDDNGKKVFVNEVIVNDKVSSTNKTSKIFMVQFKNGFQESVNDIINDEIITNGKSFDASEIVKVYTESSYDIDIYGKYILNTDILEYNYYREAEAITPVGGSYYFYEKTTNCSLVLSSDENPEMMGKIHDFYYVDKSFFSSNYRDNITIKNLEYADNKLTLSFETENCLSDTNKTIDFEFCIECENIKINVGSIKIMSGSPETIVLKHGITVEDDIVLFENGTREEDIVSSGNNRYIRVYVDYNVTTQKYEYVLKVFIGVEEYVVDFANIFNKETSPSDAALGFQDIERGKNKTYALEYISSNNEIFNAEVLKAFVEGSGSLDNLVEKFGVAVLSVTIGTTTGLIKVETIGDFDVVYASTYFETKNTANVQLNEFVKLKQKEGQDVVMSNNNFVKISNLRSNSYGAGQLTAVPKADNSWELVKIKTNPADPDEVILTITNDETLGWVFNKVDNSVPLTITFNVETIKGLTETLYLTFKSKVSISINTVWEDRILYAGTNIQLTKLEIAGGEYSDYAVFKVTKDGVNDKVSFKVGGNTVSAADDSDLTYKIPADCVGELYITAYIAGNEAVTFPAFNVLPNVIATQKEITLRSDTAYNIYDLYELGKYFTNNATVYGKDENTLYSNKVDTGVPDDLTLSIGGANTDPKLTFNVATGLTVGTMQSLAGSVTRRITLKCNGVNVSTNEFVVENQYKISGSTPNQLNALKWYDNLISIEDYENNPATGFILSEITADNLEFEFSNDGTQFRIKTPVAEELKNVLVKFIFSDGILIYQTEMTIVPYAPNTRTNIEKVYSGATFDLLDGIYNINDELEDNYIRKDEDVSMLHVSGIKYEDSYSANNVAGSVVSGWHDRDGYNSALNSAQYYPVTFNEIDGATKIIYIEYTVVYKQGGSYVYYVELVIHNRQSIETQYPENDSISSVNMRFLNEEDAKVVANVQNASPDGVYSLTNVKYESVAIHTNTTTTINFNYDEIKKLNRAVVKNDYENHRLNSSTDLIIQLVAYQQGNMMFDYVNKGINVSNANLIILPTAEKDVFGLLIFKLSTASGYVKYYNIYVYCVGDNKINVENNLEVVVYDDENKTEFEDDYLSYNINLDKTYFKFVDSIKDRIYNTFNVPYQKETTNIYLYHGTTELNGFDYNNKRWSKLSETDEILLDEHFNTITIGLVMNNNFARYCYGTITIYAQPTNAVNFGEDLNYELPNGVFTAIVEPSEKQIDCPFGSWTATILEIDGEEYDVTKHTNFTYSGSIISMVKCVGTDTKILVEYEFGNTRTFVTYTYQATVVPTQESLNSKMVTVGEFKFNGGNPEGFEKTVNLKADSYYFGTYEDSYKVFIGATQLNASTDVKLVGDTLKFNLTNEVQYVDIRIEYSNFITGAISRTFKFKVLPGVYIPESSNAGTSYTNPLETTASGDFTSNVGSKLTIDYESETDYKLYTIGGVKIYADVTVLLGLTFKDVNKDSLHDHVIDPTTDVILQDNKEITLNGGETIEFVHLEKPLSAVMNVIVKDGSGKEYAERSVYLKIAQTYSTMQAKYLVENANHENVVKSPSPLELDKDWLNSRFELGVYELLGSGNTAQTGVKYYKQENGTYVLKSVSEGSDVSGYYVFEVKSVDFETLGFTTEANPNYIVFTCSAHASIRKDSGVYKINFNEVTVATECVVQLSNRAGIDSLSGVKYTYQIMPGNNVDGLNYSSGDGAYGTYNSGTNEYISFMYDHSAGATNEFVVGTMLDSKNPGVFKIKEYSIDGGTLAIPTTPEVTETSIQYLFDNLSFCKIYIIYDITNDVIKFKVEKKAGQEVQDFVFKFSAGGVNGGDTLVKDLELVLSARKVYGNYETDLDIKMANSTVHLFEDNDSDSLLDDGIFVENGGENAQLTYEFVEGTYKVKSGEKWQKIKASNNLFVYDEVSKSAYLGTVGEDVTLIATFNAIKDDKYIVKTLTYNLMIKVNMQIVVNGEDLNKNQGNKTPETRFVLTNVSGASVKTFDDLSINFVSKKDIIESNRIESAGNFYYNVLAFDLYQGTKSNGRSSVFVTPITQDERLTVSQSGITFNKDFSGEIELELSVDTGGFGIYRVYWTIQVSGLLNLQKAAEKIGTETYAISSGVSMPIISTNVGSGDVGVVMTKSSIFTSNINLNSPKVSYEYVINPIDGNGEKSAEDLFTESMDNLSYLGTGAETEKELLLDSGLNIVLPNVPISINKQAYYVTYKIYIEYLGLTATNEKVQVFYITYCVVNEQKIEVNKETTISNPASVNVDSSLVGNYLTLFTYYETATIDSVNYSLKYTRGNVVLEDASRNTAITTSADSESVKVFEIDGKNITYNTQTRMLSNGIVSQRTTIVNRKSDNPDISDNVYSLFMSSFDNIFAFEVFIKNYEVSDSVSLTEVGKTSVKFDLKEISNSGQYGIDLTENRVELFKNEMRAEFALIDNGVKTLTIGAYATDNPSGFRLFANNTIRAKTNDGKGYTISDLFLDSYIVENNLPADAVIIGVGGDPTNNDWVINAAAGNPTIGNSYATIKIPKDSSGVNTYYVKKVTYTGTVGSTFYSISQDFYYIYLNGNADLILPDYNSAGIETTYFKITYKPDASGNVNLDLSSAFIKWSMDTTKGMVEQHVNSISDYYSDDSKGANYGSEKITISSSALNAYKLQNPYENDYENIYANIEIAEEITLRVRIVFVLPSEVEIGVTYSGGDADITVGNYSNLKEVLCLDGYLETFDAATHDLKLNGEKLKDYFDNNPNVTKLTISCEATNNDDETIDFKIVVKKT